MQAIDLAFRALALDEMIDVFFSFLKIFSACAAGT